MRCGSGSIPAAPSTLGLTAGEVVEALAQPERAGRRRRRRPAALRHRRGAAAQRRNPGPLQDRRRVRQHRHPHRSGDGRRSRGCRDVARVELGAADYGVNAYLSGSRLVDPRHHPAPGHQRARRRRRRARPSWTDAAKTFPKGLEYRIIWNPTEFISQSIDRGAGDACSRRSLLVVLVILVFLQSWRAAIIPIVAIPVSLIGTFAVLLALGYSLNTLSMFGLVLAIGIVVDDAIVVVENVERNLEHGLSSARGGAPSMDEVSAALVAIVLVLCAVFVPTTFLTGIIGRILPPVRGDHRRSTIISLLLSLTLSPALAARAAAAEERASRGSRRAWASSIAPATGSTAASRG